MFGTVQPTEFDLRFKILGVPVRVSAWFWLAGVILGYSALRVGIQYLIAWLLVLFVSILVHELGHALVAGYFGYPPRILLYHFGGLTFFEPHSRFTRSKSIAISLAGPCIGFILFGLIILFESTALPTVLQKLSQPNAFLLGFTILQLKYINLFWGLVNLLPVMPLDGGQICRDICMSWSPRRGTEIAIKIGIFVSGSAALYFFLEHSTYAAMLFAMLCASNVSTLQNARGRW